MNNSCISAFPTFILHVTTRDANGGRVEMERVNTCIPRWSERVGGRWLFQHTDILSRSCARRLPFSRTYGAETGSRVVYYRKDDAISIQQALPISLHKTTLTTLRTLHTRLMPILPPQRKQLFQRLHILNLQRARQLCKHGIRRVRVLVEYFFERLADARGFRGLGC